MRLFTLLLGLFTVNFSAICQDENNRLDDLLDEVTFNWDREAKALSTYEGLLYACGNKEYRTEIISMLNQIHHLDSSLYSVLQDLSLRSTDKEIKKTLKEVREFEAEYDTKSFIHFMSQECKAAKAIEKESKDTRNAVGQNSYSGQVYLLETELLKYINQVTQRIDKIRKHVHHLSPHYEY